MARFDLGPLDAKEVSELESRISNIRRGIIEMTTLAKSGHIGGPLGFADTAFLLYYGSDLQKDYIFWSAGHYSALAYSALAETGNGFSLDDVVVNFRKIGSRFEGHVSTKVPGIPFDTGILGQGLSAAVGYSYGLKKIGKNGVNIFVAMGDGEQNKGQIAEALRAAKKHNLNNITVVVDNNLRQLSGATYNVMPTNIARIYKAAGWNTIEVEGHDIKGSWEALRKARAQGFTAVIARTVMGKGVPKIEGDHGYHGMPLSREDAVAALHDLGFEDRFGELEKLRNGVKDGDFIIGSSPVYPLVEPAELSFYSVGDSVACRKAWGKALMGLAEANFDGNGKPKTFPVVVIDCDLFPSVQTGKFMELYPDYFFQSGIQEHHAATMAGALSRLPVLTFFSDFGVLAVDEVYQQHRLTAINKGNLKLVSTHNGLDVGEDGKTHQCLDYLLLDNVPGWKTFVPADANQAMHVVNYMATHNGCFHLAMGRSKLPIISRQDSDVPFFGEGYVFAPGKVDVLRDYGLYAVILTYGSLAWRAVSAAETLREEGFGVKVLNVSTPSRLDIHKILRSVSDSARLLVTYEDHFVGEQGRENSGLAPVVKALFYGHKHQPLFKSMGVRRFGLSGPAEELYRAENLHQDDLCEVIRNNV